MQNWDDKTDEIVSYCVDYKEDGIRKHLFIEENRNIERFRVRCFHNGIEYGVPMHALDWDGVDALISLISGKKRKGWRVA